MSDPRTLAAAYGLTVELADLGDWDRATLISEYDHQACAIRINERALERYRRACGGEVSSCDLRTFIDTAVAHELYHHREAIGEVPRLPTRAEREAAANAYACERVPPDVKLAAFIGAARHAR